MATDSKELVLVTGGTGFLAAHCIIRCLAAGYRVRTTVRSLKRKDEVVNMLKAGKATNIDDVSYVEADLLKDDGWHEAVKDCMYPAPPKHDDELIVPARDGTLRVLRASRDAGVKRVVVTSSMAAVTGGNGSRDASNPFTEDDWTDVDKPGVGAYEKSKTLAERAAWDFIKNEGGKLELSTVNPCTVLGPVLSKDSSTSIEIIIRLMNGAIPGCPNLNFTIVDVRDVADLHYLAMTNPKASGERFVCVGPPRGYWIYEMSRILREKLGHKARRAPTRQLPDFLLRTISWFDSSVALVCPMLGLQHAASTKKAETLLGWAPRTVEESIVASAESLIEFGVVKA
ncbi:nucleoside-diphosphate-sugar epimerase [Penicillium chermesinum]|uniref:Nucleoside-diphosphate-sugar epimerase n=1 Tax=Penicillium chermesinum TaxID=63820 RepID=A0A9W9NIC5_9EURO|nr:nucleoside-diphosphate-sugar epimerase [Penicillium chermesinum]KAJ5220318.1 nucleoside-diphosphate-sugar epimerase [Penicillium chermesinum]KAJ6157761.1 nucleoside-diphosphate-sugar epimerase [Penicillium chermesinum]